MAESEPLLPAQHVVGQAARGVNGGEEEGAWDPSCWGETARFYLPPDQTIGNDEEHRMLLAEVEALEDRLQGNTYLDPTEKTHHLAPSSSSPFRTLTRRVRRVVSGKGPLTTAASKGSVVAGAVTAIDTHGRLKRGGRRPVGDALRTAFNITDRELLGTETGDFVGATAVVAVVGKTHIWVAHCGDSRAVIQRNGEAEALTRDHKPDREDEAVACIERTPSDEVLVLATDGLWDVFSCKEATTLAMRCIVRSKERGMSRHGACRVAASVLTKVALERGSRDNITVIVVDITVQLNFREEEDRQAGHQPASSASTQAAHSS
ncbi:PPM-type phosphatase domain-containing protein, partial [Haematococcus lacustris]